MWVLFKNIAKQTSFLLHPVVISAHLSCLCRKGRKFTFTIDTIRFKLTTADMCGHTHTHTHTQKPLRLKASTGTDLLNGKRKLM